MLTAVQVTQPPPKRQATMSERRITTLTLSFPWGATVKECDTIAQKVQDVVMAGVSEGGFTPTTKYGINVEGCEFSEDSMLYIYGHNRNTSGPIEGHPAKDNHDG